MPVPFIVGASRSGTTVLRLMLDAHPDMAIPPETRFVSEAIRHCRKGPQARECFIETVRSSPRWADFHLDIDVLTQRIDGLGRFDLGTALRAFYALYAERQGKGRWGDKTPVYLTHMLHIKQVLPEVHFVHLIRDGRDVALSIQGLWFGPDSIQDAAEWWVSRVTAAREQAQLVRSYLEVRYEDLIEAPELTLRRVCDYIHLPWDAAMLEYHARAPERIAELGSLDASSQGRFVPADERRQIHALTSRPPDTGRIGRWRSEMSEADRWAFESIAGSTLRMLGYDIE